MKADLPLLSAGTNRSSGGPQPMLGSVTHLCQSQQAPMTCALPGHRILFFWCLWPKSTPTFWFDVIVSFMSKRCQSWAQVKRRQVISQVHLLVLCVRGWERVHTVVYKWRWEDGFWELVLFNCVGLGARTWIIRLGSRCLYTLAHSPAPCGTRKAGKLETWVQITCFSLFF